MGSKRFDTERSEVENLVCMYLHRYASTDVDRVEYMCVCIFSCLLLLEHLLVYKNNI